MIRRYTTPANHMCETSTQNPSSLVPRSRFLIMHMSLPDWLSLEGKVISCTVILLLHTSGESDMSFKGLRLSSPVLNAMFET